MKKVISKCLCLIIIIIAPTWNIASAQEHRKIIPILMYHHISNTIKSDWSIGTKELDEQLAYLKDNGYKSINMDQLYSYITKNKTLPDKSVLITFDDGYNDAYYNAFPLLKKYGFKATFFVITGQVLRKNIDGNDYMLLSQLKELNKSGMEIESHSVSHPYLSTLNNRKQYYELSKSKRYLDRHLHQKTIYLAYPYGDYNKLTINDVKKIGYKMALTVNGNHQDDKDNIDTIARIYINQKTTIDKFKSKLDNGN